MSSFRQELRQGPFLQIWLTIMGRGGRLLWVSDHLPLLKFTAAPFFLNSQIWGAPCSGTRPLLLTVNILSLESWTSLVALKTIRMLMTLHFGLQPGPLPWSADGCLPICPLPLTKEYLSKEQRR